MSENGKKDANQGEGRESLVIQSKVKEYIRSQGLMCSGDLVDALNGQIYGLLDSAIRRATANSRKTARADDI